MKDFLAIGQIINTHGVKGEVKVYPLTDNVKRFKKLEKVFINNKERAVLGCKLQANKVILKIEGIDTIEEAIKYRNNYLEVKREDAVKLPKGSYFIADIIGCIVYDENDVIIGEISDVIQTPSNDVYWIKSPQEVLIPALKKIVSQIDIENKKIVVKPLEEWQ